MTPGATLWRDGGSMLELDGRVDAGSLLEGLRRAGVTALEAVVARTDGVSVRAALDAVRRRYDIGRVLLPSNTRTDVSLRVGRLWVDVHPSAGHLIVEIEPSAAGSARGPPV